MPSARVDFRCPLAYRATVWGKQGQMEGVNTAVCGLTRGGGAGEFQDFSRLTILRPCPPVTGGRGESLRRVRASAKVGKILEALYGWFYCRFYKVQHEESVARHLRG